MWILLQQRENGRSEDKVKWTLEHAGMGPIDDISKSLENLGSEFSNWMGFGKNSSGVTCLSSEKMFDRFFNGES